MSATPRLQWHLCVIGIDLQRAAIACHRLVELPVAEQRIADVVIGAGIIGLVVERGAERSQRPVQVALQQQHITAIEMGACRVGCDADRVQIALHRLVQPALGLKRMALLDQAGRVLGRCVRGGRVRPGVAGAGRCSAAQSVEYAHLGTFSG